MKVAQAKQDALANLDTLRDLNQPQRDALRNQINQVSRLIQTNKAVTTMNQAKDALNGDEKLAQAKQDALANLDTLRDLNQPQRDALRNQIMRTN